VNRARGEHSSLRDADWTRALQGLGA